MAFWADRPVDWKRDRSQGPGMYWITARRGVRAVVVASQAPLVGRRVYELRTKRAFGGWKRKYFDTLPAARDAGEDFLLGGLV